MARKLDVAESNLITENTPSSLFLLVGVSFLLFLVHVLSFALSLTLFNDAALQLLLCGLMSSSITLTSRPFSYANASLTKPWLATAFEGIILMNHT